MGIRSEGLIVIKRSEGGYCRDPAFVNTLTVAFVYSPLLIASS